MSNIIHVMNSDFSTDRMQSCDHFGLSKSLRRSDPPLMLPELHRSTCEKCHGKLQIYPV